MHFKRAYKGLRARYGLRMNLWKVKEDMKTVVLHFKNIRTRTQAHEYLKKELGFPDYYGENLDALWDMLTNESERLEIVIRNGNEFIENLGEYGKNLLDTMLEAGEENPMLSIEWE